MRIAGVKPALPVVPSLSSYLRQRVLSRTELVKEEPRGFRDSFFSAADSFSAGEDPGDYMRSAPPDVVAAVPIGLLSRIL